MSTVVSDLLRRSFIYRILDAAGAELSPIGDTAIASRYSTVEEELQRAKELGLADLSPLSRSGYKGRGTPDWLRTQGLSLPTAPNQAILQDDGTLVAALSWDEYLLLANPVHNNNPYNNPWSALDAAWTLDTAPACYQLPRRDSHCWFALTGEHTSKMLAKVCAVDLRLHKFTNRSIAQTSLARINVIVIRNDLGQTPAFYALADSASAAYLWRCFIDAMDEFDGAPVGLQAIRSLIS